MNKKGQAALEFLTTYGWAFLVILVMIGALAYFGILSPKNLLPSRCNFSPEIDCIEAQITGGTNPVLNFRFRNNLGSSSTFNITSTYIGATNPTITCENSTGGNQVADLQSGRVAEAVCRFTGSTFAVGDKAKFEVTLLYKKSDGTYWTPIKGEIFGSIN